MHTTLLPATGTPRPSRVFSLYAVFSLLFLFLSGIASDAFASVFYVKNGGTGDGTASWANATADLQAAIDAASAGDEIWVAGGSYTASLKTDNTRAFQMKEGVRIYGGFAGTESTLEARDLGAGNKSVLYTRSIAAEIMRNPGNLTSAALLDGFTFNGTNYGNMILNSDGSPMFVNVEIVGAAVAGYGSMMYNSAASPILINCLLINRGGVGMINQRASPILVNCTISKSASLPTTGMTNGNNSSPRVYNSIILGSQTGMVNTEGAIIRYSQVRGFNDPDSTHHNVTGNLDGYLTSDHRVSACSPGLNKGSNTYYEGDLIPALKNIVKDLSGNKRFYNNGTIDLGAFEYQGDEPVGSVAGVWYVKPGGTGRGKNWDCALNDLAYAISLASAGDEIWVAGGSYTAANNTDNTRAFQMKEGVRIYGGFAGNELSREARDLSAGNTSNLYAQSQVGYVIDNAAGLTNASVLDGFTLTGLYNIVRNSSSSPTFVNVTVVGPAVRGGFDIILNINASPTLINCLIINRGGTGISNQSASPVILNCTIASNSSLPTTGMVNQGNSAPQILNSIILGNQTGITNAAAAVIRHSLVKGFSDTDATHHNLPGNEDPYLANYRPTACSPGLNKGNNAYYQENPVPTLPEITKDLGGNSRFFNGGIVDLGAFEYQGAEQVTSVTGVWYVKPGGTGAGKSWGCALGNLQTAINSASSGEQVWVAAGTYQPGSGPRYSMKEGVKIYGGFAGNETNLDQRNLSITANKSILSGNSGPGVLSNTGLTLTRAAVLDGFTITGSAGAPAIQNSTGSSPMLVNITVTGNNFTGMSVFDSSPELINCSFVNNASPSVGGGLLLSGATPILTNCLISGNTAAAEGGGIFNANSTPVITNCTIVRNTSGGQGGGIFNAGGQSFPIRNSIVYGNSTGLVNVPQEGVLSSLVQVDGNPGTSIDPLFVDANAGDYRLKPCSPAVNAGVNYFQEGQSPDISGVTADLDNNPRIREHIVDLGAYEFGGTNRQLATDMDEASANIARDAVLTSADCRLLAYLNPGGVVNGTGAVSGPVDAKVWVAATQPQEFVKRHYQITPSTNAAATSARVTLFFTQQEFDDFNAVNAVKLPLNPADQENNKANLRIEKRSGASSDGSGLPHSYPGTVSTFKPSDMNGHVVWNADAQYWEVTFDVTGFSGFFVKTNQSALPLNLISFTATREVGSTLLQWRTTSEVNTESFEIQRSSDAKTFIKITTVAAVGSGDGHYSYHDQNRMAGNVYYRLKMSDRETNDLDGTFTYSKIIALLGQGNPDAIYPNPASEIVTFQVGNALLGTSARLYDMTGRHIRNLDITENKQQITIQSLASGVYILKFADGSFERFVKK